MHDCVCVTVYVRDKDRVDVCVRDRERQTEHTGLTIATTCTGDIVPSDREVFQRVCVRMHVCMLMRV